MSVILPQKLPGDPLDQSQTLVTKMRCLRLLRTGVALAVAFSTFTLFLLCLHMSPTPYPDLKELPVTHTAQIRTPPPSRPRPAPCRANRSVAELPDFMQQPEHVRNFLLHKHCRNFPLLQDVPPAKCAQPVFLLLVIKSSPSNYERRDLVRRTWGRERKVRGVHLRRLFLVGTARNPLEARKVNWLLAMEARAHGDILQWDFQDSFFNLTLKQVGWRGSRDQGHLSFLSRWPPPSLRGPGDQQTPLNLLDCPHGDVKSLSSRGGRKKEQGASRLQAWF